MGHLCLTVQLVQFFSDQDKLFHPIIYIQISGERSLPLSKASICCSQSRSDRCYRLGFLSILLTFALIYNNITYYCAGKLSSKHKIYITSHCTPKNFIYTYHIKSGSMGVRLCGPQRWQPWAPLS